MPTTYGRGVSSQGSKCYEHSYEAGSNPQLGGLKRSILTTIPTERHVCLRNPVASRVLATALLVVGDE